MILLSLAACLGSAIFLCVTAGQSVICLYLGTAILGFFISWQFGAAFSWVAKKKNITGKTKNMKMFFVDPLAADSCWKPSMKRKSLVSLTNLWARQISNICFFAVNKKVHI